MMPDPLSRSPISFSDALALISRLYWALDAGDADMLAACFEPDATWHRPDGPRTGHAALREIATDRPPDRKTTHVPSNLVLLQEEDRIIGHYYLTVFGEASGVVAHLNCCFDCQDEIVVTAHGVRIREKRTRMRMKFA
jgi:hypothetical protein